MSTDQEPQDEAQEQDSSVATAKAPVEEKPIDISFPRKIGDNTFQTPEEMQAFLDKMTASTKEARQVLKAVRPGRPPSQKKVLAEATADILNKHMTKDLREKLGTIDEDIAIRVMFEKETSTFVAPTPKPREGGDGGGPRGGRPLVVDGKEYPSAKNARDTLHTDTVGNQQNRKAIISYLRGKEHTIEKDQD